MKTFVESVSDGRLLVTVLPGFGALRRIQFGTSQHGQIVLAEPNQALGPGQDLVLPPGTTSYSFSLMVDLAAVTVPAGQPLPPVTLSLTVYDDYGDASPWPTFVGGGQAALLPSSVPIVSLADARATEGDIGLTPLTFAASLSAPSTLPVVVHYATVDGTATAPDDYIAAGGLLTFAPGETQRTLIVQVRGDRAVEPDETFTVRLSNPSGATLGRQSAAGTIENDDASPTAQDDVYVAQYGKPLSVSARTGVLQNDSAGSTTAEVISFGAASVGGLSTSNAAGSQIGLSGNGSLRVRADGSFDFTPPAPFARTFTFQYRLSGPTGHSDATVTITVANVPPTAIDDTVTVTEDSPPAPLDVLSNDTDPDGGLKLVRSVTQPAHGTLTVVGDGDSLLYAPDANACSTLPGTPLDTFQYSLAPGDSTATVQVIVTCVNDPPGLTNSAGQTAYNVGGTPVIVDGALAVGDVDTPTLASATVMIADSLDGADETLAANTASTSIAAGYVAPVLTLTGTDTLDHYQQVLRSVSYADVAKAPSLGLRTVRFVLDDGAAQSATSVRIVSVERHNQPPVAENVGTVDVKPGARTPITLRGIDVETCDLTFTPVSKPAHGTLSKPEDGKCVPGSPNTDTVTVTYTPNGKYSGPDSFSFTVTDTGDGVAGPETSAPATVTLNVLAP